MWLCHFPEVPAPLVDVAYWGKTGRHLLAMSSSQFDPKLASAISYTRSLLELPRITSKEIRMAVAFAHVNRSLVLLASGVQALS